MGQPTIPAGATVTAATMTVNIVSGTSTAYNAKASQVTGSWESAAMIMLIKWPFLAGYSIYDGQQIAFSQAFANYFWIQKVKESLQ